MPRKQVDPEVAVQAQPPVTRPDVKEGDGSGEIGFRAVRDAVDDYPERPLAEALDTREPTPSTTVEKTPPDGYIDVFKLQD